MEVLRPDRLGQLQRVPRALDVRAVLRVGVGGEVVDGREVEEVVDLAVESLDLGVVDGQPRLGEVADDGDDPVVVAQPLLQRVQLVERAGPGEAVDLALAVVEELREEEAADEARR